MDETPQGNEPAQKQPNVPPAPTPPLSSQLKLEESESMEQETRSRDESGSSDQQQTDQRAQSEAQASELQSSSTPSNQPSDLDGQNKTEEQRQQQQQPQQQQRQHPEELYSSARWGTTPIRQDTPWELPPSPTQTQPPQSIASSAIGDRGQPPMQVSSMNLVGGGQAANALAVAAAAAASAASSRFEQPWRAPVAPIKQPSLATSASFANHNLMNAAPGGMQKSLLNSGNGAGPNPYGGAMGGGMGGLQHGGEFARAPGPASSLLDANSMASKPFGMTQRASTWSSFGTPPGPSESDSEWPKSSTTAGISTGGNSVQPPANAFAMVHEFEPGKSWHGSNLMKGLDDDSPMNLGPAPVAGPFPGGYANFSSPKSPTGSQYEPSGIGTWSPVVKGGRPGSMWDGDGPDGRGGDNGRFDDGTAIWGGGTVQTKGPGVDWDKTGDANVNDKSRSSSMAGNNQSTYRPQQQPSSSSTSLLMSSNTSPSSQHNRNQHQTLKQPSLSHNFDQVQQPSNVLSSQANQPNRGLGLSSNVPSKHQQQQLTTMVQQIQLAVQAGHLNPQILNQPLAPVTLQLLYQLLQQIRSLQQLQMKFNQPGNHQAAIGVQMTKTKQNILNLQNQIAAQQAIHLKQQTQAHNISSRQPTMPSLATGGLGGGIGPALPPGISQSGDSFRSSNSVGDFHGQAIVNNFGVDSMSANGLATSLGHMSLGGTNVLHSNRFDQSWRAPTGKPHPTSMASSSSFANHNLMNAAPGGVQKTMLNSSGNGGSSYVGMHQGGGEFARAPGPATSMMDNMAPKPYGVANRSSSTWSAFGNSGQSESEPEWPKTTTSSGISSSNTTQSSNAFDLVPEFEPGKPWRGSMLLRSVEDDPTMTPGSMARSLAPQRKTIWSDEIL